MNTQSNILIIHVDQHRWDCLGAYGNTDVQSPHIDALAGDGVVYENGFCPYPICTPSRYSLLSGLYVHEHRGVSNQSTLAAELPALPRILKEHGYHTKAVGKMHFTPTYLDVGFDEMELAEQCGDGRYDDDYHRWLRDHDQYDRLDIIDQVDAYRKDAPSDYWQSFGSMRSDLDEKYHSTTWIADRSIESIEQWDADDGGKGSGGNFLMAGFIKPHHPCDPPAPWDTMYDPQDLTLLPGWTEELIHGDDGEGFFSFKDMDETALRKVMAMYYASISQIDFHVGRMINVLKEKGIYDNTIIVYTSDHGDMMGYHHRILKAYRSMEPLHRVPLIIKYAGAESSARDQRLVNNIHLAPTLLSAVGIEVPTLMSGEDIQSDTFDPEYALSWFHNEYIIRSKTHKLLLHRDAEKSMFFDLLNDPCEMKNLIDEPSAQELIEVFKNQLATWPDINNPAENYIDRDAAQCTAANVPQTDTGLYDYFKDHVIRDQEKSLQE
ncbi:MAG: sulfatase-like hydrolase/transferase [Planctomycetes bacterium]|nr:sulfatase-like hydrolase/transferase [Planctomycetota bacterium]